MPHRPTTVGTPPASTAGASTNRHDKAKHWPGGTSVTSEHIRRLSNIRLRHPRRVDFEGSPPASPEIARSAPTQRKETSAAARICDAYTPANRGGPLLYSRVCNGPEEGPSVVDNPHGNARAAYTCTRSFQMLRLRVGSHPSSGDHVPRTIFCVSVSTC